MPSLPPSPPPPMGRLAEAVHEVVWGARDSTIGAWVVHEAINAAVVAVAIAAGCACLSLGSSVRTALLACACAVLVAAGVGTARAYARLGTKRY